VTEAGGEIVHVTNSAAETEAVGGLFGGVLQTGDLICLTGDLGAGKTVFVRGVCTGLGGDAGAVRSPTFVLEHLYRGGRVPLHHIDCYRLGPGANLDVLDLETSLATGAVIVEWGDYADVAGYHPVRVSFEIGDGDRRSIHLEDDPGGRFKTAWDQWERP
jgi:tRNA threonylcarbamoyladenosine biosynthesis protein TsaE